MPIKDRRIDRFKVYSRRAAILAGFKGLLVSGLVARMYYLQVIESDRYQMLAEENRISVRLLAPLRGLIVDRFGRVLAANRADYRAYLIPEQTRSVDDTLDALSRIIPLSRDDHQRIRRAVQRQRAFLPVTVAANLSWTDFARINLASPDLPGVQPDVGSTRYYPHGPLVAHLIGYVGAPGEDEVGRDPLLQLPGFKVGRNGIERTFDSQLRGQAGNMKVEVNAVGRVIRELERKNAVQGSTVQLTIDFELQRYAADRLAGESGSVVVVDVKTGEILALVSVPAFDPNDFNLGISRTKWQSLLADKRKPLINKAVAGQYPPGSTFKMAVALAALEAGVIKPDHKVACWGKKELGNHTFHCWKREGHGVLDLVNAIQHSCDIYFYDIADRVGIDRIAEMARRLGLGSAPDLPIPAVASGLVPSPGWKLATQGVRWQRGETWVAGIGQGYITATPLQLAVMTARIANGAHAISPVLTVTPRSGEAIDKAPAPLNISRAALDVVREGMARVTTHPRGTAYAARITDDGYAMAGKTGTAQVRRITKAEREAGVRKNEEKPWEERDHALFVGYGPIEDPRYAVAVVVEHGGSGSRTAAPIARDVLLKAMRANSAAAPVDKLPEQPTLTPERGVDV
ncbi:MAG: penicillin-binding protein 2 [Alphaproteobacteria bacterium]|nr:MAG: penicillin-binding protein 2 [Alphaproteobacteria bacterium]